MKQWKLDWDVIDPPQKSAETSQEVDDKSIIGIKGNNSLAECDNSKGVKLEIKEEAVKLEPGEHSVTIGKNSVTSNSGQSLGQGEHSPTVSESATKGSNSTENSTGMGNSGGCMQIKEEVVSPGRGVENGTQGANGAGESGATTARDVSVDVQAGTTNGGPGVALPATGAQQVSRVSPCCFLL